MMPRRPFFHPARRRSWGRAAFILFLIFVAYRILTPNTKEVARIPSPNGARTARLRKIYYVAQPSYKIDYRQTGKWLWLNLLYLPAYTNAPSETTVETLQWSPDSQKLFFRINNTSIWSHTFNTPQ